MKEIQRELVEVSNHMTKKEKKKLKKKRMRKKALKEKKKPKSNTEGEDRFSELPMDISLDILSRLPLKTLSNCRWVSKTWYNFIIHPRLAEIHFARFGESLPCAIFHSRYRGSHLIDPDCFPTHQTTTTAYHFVLKQFKENFTISNGWTCFEVVGTVNGMICFSPERCDYEPAPYYICNPITRDYVLLPKSPKVDVEPIGSGFGFDSLNNEYKVVRILPNSTKDGNEVEIYTMGSGMWRQIQIGVPYVAGMVNQSHALLNGCLHWSPSIKIDSKRYETILSFNVATEKFNLMRMPPISDTRLTMLTSFDLIVLGNRLCVVDGGFMGDKDVWVMKEYGVRESWVKENVFESDNLFCGWNGFHETLDLKNNVLLLLNRDGYLSYYDYQKKTSKKIMIRDLKPQNLERSSPIYFTGSLFSPKVIECN